MKSIFCLLDIQAKVFARFITTSFIPLMSVKGCSDAVFGRCLGEVMVMGGRFQNVETHGDGPAPSKKPTAPKARVKKTQKGNTAGGALMEDFFAKVSCINSVERAIAFDEPVDVMLAVMGNG